MFARSNWSIFGIDPAQQQGFRQALNDQALMLRWSQVVASAVVRTTKLPAIGINPFDRPRLDEDQKLSGYETEQLAQARAQREPYPWFEAEHLYRSGEEGYRIDENRYGFWLVYNDWRDVSDVASIREDLAYLAKGLPYRLLNKSDKKSVEEKFTGQTTVIRKQFPVMLDFTQGKVFAETTSQANLELLCLMLKTLGVDSYPMHWKFLSETDWIRPVLAQLLFDSRFKDAFQKRAEDRMRNPSSAIEKSEDQELEKILAQSFSMTELETEEWIGLGTPAEIKLYPAADRVVAVTPTNASMLLHAADEAAIQSAQLLFQERVIHYSKKGEERTFRRDLFRMQLADNINDHDAGVGLLRGFDLPGFRRDVQRQLRRTKQTPTIASLWLNWLRGMEDAVRLFTAAVAGVLDKNDGLREDLGRQLDRGEYGLVRLPRGDTTEQSLVLIEGQEPASRSELLMDEIARELRATVPCLSIEVVK